MITALLASVILSLKILAPARSSGEHSTASERLRRLFDELRSN
jgi:hypothetical protein